MDRPDQDKNRIELVSLLSADGVKGAPSVDRFWRSLQELAQTEEYKDFLHHEFPRGLGSETPGVSRRDVLRLMGASAALAGLTACTKLPPEKIVPYVRQPEEFVPGKPLFYATAMPFGGVATGLLVESHLGRPTKVEGNPQHPASLGSTDVFAQASVLTLYDPDRSQVLVNEGRIGSWSAFLAALNNVRDAQKSRQGASLRILTETVTSPTLASQLRAVLAEFPQAKWHQYDPAGRDAARAGSRLAFGEYVNTVYHLERAEVILSLGSDFLYSGPGSVRYAREFADKRRLADSPPSMNRLYVVESTPSVTGTMADHRLPLRASEIEPLARVLAQELGVNIGEIPAAPATRQLTDWIPALVRDLQQHRGACVVLAGEHESPVVHALAHAMNQALDNLNKTVVCTDPVEASPIDQMQSLRELAADMQAGLVEVLLILGANPVYTAPADLGFADHLLKVGLRIHLGLYDDETAELCHWHVPEAHFLESWSDARAYDGTVAILQPLIAPLYDGKSAHELLAILLGQAGRTAHDIVHDYWKGQNAENGDHRSPLQGHDPSKEFEKFWETTLHDGVMAGTALPAKQVSLKVRMPVGPSRLRRPSARAGASPGPTQPESGMEIIFRPDSTLWDGRFANNGWLQELPKPLSKLTWDNVAHVSPATAASLGLTNGEVVELRYGGRTVRAPVWITPGQPAECVTVHLGYGRKRAGRVGTGRGFNAYALRTADQPWFGKGLELAKVGEHYLLAGTQHHNGIDTTGQERVEESAEAARRGLLRVATLEEFRKHPDFAKDSEEMSSRARSLYPGFKYEGYAWGMAIDLNSCTGCNACVVACQAENNIPVVGKDQVAAGREMHWIRIDTYFRGGLDNPETYHEPVPCMHCENAPCEVVCPVGATTHSPEGLNEMVYNRCVGTRYCSNNCPYKVRRFNFLLYSDWNTPSLFGLRNPNVTVRSRGVMEKCTYCVQRINATKIEAEKQDREVRDGEITTACEQSCPTKAIVFGNINDPNSRVSRLKAQSRQYALLAELNTRPRTTYLARLRNPNPEIKE